MHIYTALKITPPLKCIDHCIAEALDLRSATQRRKRRCEDPRTRFTHSSFRAEEERRRFDTRRCEFRSDAHKLLRLGEFRIRLLFCARARAHGRIAEVSRSFDAINGIGLTRRFRRGMPPMIISILQTENRRLWLAKAFALNRFLHSRAVRSPRSRRKVSRERERERQGDEEPRDEPSNDDDLTRRISMIVSDSRRHSNLTRPCLMRRHKAADCRVHMSRYALYVHLYPRMTGDSLSRGNFTTRYRISIIFDFRYCARDTVTPR